MPVMHLLGVHETRLRCYATGGYYREGQTMEELVQEYMGYVAQGFTAVKLKVGKLSPREDASRLGAVRCAVGDEVEILLDANGAWPDSNTAISALRRMREHRPYWIEEPVATDDIDGSARVADALATPIAG